MAFIRSILCCFVLFTFGVFALLFNIFVQPVAKILLNENDYIYFSSDLIHFSWQKMLLNLLKGTGLIKLDIKNLSELKSIKNKVIVATHPSFIDIVILIALIPRTTCIVKEELAKNPIMSNLVKSIFITNDIDIDKLKTETKKMLDLGFNVVIFPAGIRHKKDEKPKLKKGAPLIALNAQKDISPVKMYSDGEFMFINKPIYDVDKSTVVFHIEKLEDIEICNYKELNEIASKKALTQEIANALYN